MVTFLVAPRSFSEERLRFGIYARPTAEEPLPPKSPPADLSESRAGPHRPDSTFVFIFFASRAFFYPRWGGSFFCLSAVERSASCPRRACPCEYVARRPPHRRWVQETQPHTCGCAERILTAELQKQSFRPPRGCRNAKFFQSPPPTGINSSSGSALRSGGNVEARICAGPTCGPGVIKTRPECRYQPSARSYKRPKALKWIPRHIRCAVLFRTPRIAPELILRLQGAAERCRHSTQAKIIRCAHQNNLGSKYHRMQRA